MQAGSADCIYENDLGKSCFEHNMAYGKCKELTERTESDKVLTDKVFIITSYPKYYGNQKGLVSMLYKFFMKNSLAVV